MKLSIILPVAAYNVQWVDAAITSTAGIADELVVVTDEACEFHPAWNNNPLVHQVITIREPRSLAKAYNAGIAVCTGDWISCLSSDDEYAPVGAMEMKEHAAKSDQDIIGGIIHFHGSLGEIYWPPSGDLSIMDKENCIDSSAYQRKTIWWKIGGFEDVRYLDWHYWKKALSAGFKHHWFGKVMHHHRCWPGSIGGGYNYRSDLGHEWDGGPRERK